MKHIGFKAAVASVAAKQGIPIKNASAIIAAGARKASVAARSANPALNNVSGMPPRRHAPKVASMSRVLGIGK